jgi:hypothetical protein
MAPFGSTSMTTFVSGGVWASAFSIRFAQRVGNRRSIPDDADRVIGAGQRDRTAGFQDQIRH